jgi:hypothetical protein
MLTLICILGLTIAFLLVVVVTLYTQIIRPMRKQLARVEAKQETTESIVQGNADASLGLYFATCRQIGVINRKLAIEVVTDDVAAPITQREPQTEIHDDGPLPKRMPI